MCVVYAGVTTGTTSAPPVGYTLHHRHHRRRACMYVCVCVCVCVCACVCACSAVPTVNKYTLDYTRAGGNVMTVAWDTTIEHTSDPGVTVKLITSPTQSWTTAKTLITGTYTTLHYHTHATITHINYMCVCMHE